MSKGLFDKLQNSFPCTSAMTVKGLRAYLSSRPGLKVVKEQEIFHHFPSRVSVSLVGFSRLRDTASVQDVGRKSGIGQGGTPTLQ